MAAGARGKWQGPERERQAEEEAVCSGVKGPGQGDGARWTGGCSPGQAMGMAMSIPRNVEIKGAEAAGGERCPCGHRQCPESQGHGKDKGQY